MKNKFLGLALVTILLVPSYSQSMGAIEVIAKMSDLAETFLGLAGKISKAIITMKNPGDKFDQDVKKAKALIDEAKTQEGKDISAQLNDISAALVQVKDAKKEETVLLNLLVSIVKDLNDKVVKPTVDLVNKSTKNAKVTELSVNLTTFINNIDKRMKTGKELLDDIESLSDEVKNVASSVDDMQTQLKRLQKGGAKPAVVKPAVKESEEAFAF